MKAINTIAKVLTALAAVAGVVYIIATYGDKIVAWAKKLLASCPCKCSGEDTCACDGEGACVCAAEAPAEEAPAEEATAEEAPVEEPTPVPAEDVPVADEKDFEG